MKLVFSILFLFVYGTVYTQIVFDTIPLNKQLLGRDIITNTGDIIINGSVDNTSTPYDSLKVKLYRNNVPLDSVSKLLAYTGSTAPFNFKIPITAELENYKIEIFGKTGTVETFEKVVDSLVAGDVFIIQGQSNAVSYNYGDTVSEDPNRSPYIRVYANGTSNDTDLVANDNWYEGSGGLWIDENGNTGSWGLKLAKTLIDSLQIPVAIFNGGYPGATVSFFEPDSFDYTYMGSNYGWLHYRLDKTGLKDFVKGVFWAQGEADGSANGNTPINDYKNSFLNIKNAWLTHYPNIEHIYMFQTKNGACDGSLYLVKEAQRQLAFENNDISIMSTAGFTQRGDGCHFDYEDGYEEFANRIFPLAYRDLYGGVYAQEIDAPMITGASMINDTTLVVDTDAINLIFGTSKHKNAPSDPVVKDSIIKYFELGNAGATTIDSINIATNKILLYLSGNPGLNPTISFLAQPREIDGHFVTNSSGIEILSFYQYPILVEPPSSFVITQYYEGIGPNDQWVEVKNISSNPINGGDFYLSLFDQAKAVDGTIQTSPPDQSEPIVNSGGLGFPIAPGEVILFKRPSAAIPFSLNLGSSHVITSQVCDFDGDDVILISSTNGSNSFNDKVDIIGVVAASGAPPIWGQDKSFVKGHNNLLEPSMIFDETNYVELKLTEVDNAISDMNIALGTQNEGLTTWTFGGVWDNGTSDRTRSAVLLGGYDQSNGSLSAGTLRIESIVDFNNTSTEYIEVSDSLIIETGGLLTIGDKASLYTVNASHPDSIVAILGNIGKTETTTSLTDSGDYTYWSSPIENESTINVFPPTMYNQSRIYYWDQSVPNADGLGGSEALGEWINASNTVMKSGKGYISQGPTSGSFPNTTDVIFNGKPNTGIIQLVGGNDVVFNDETLPDPVNPNNDLILIGNPYPSAIDADKFLLYSTNQSSISGTLWFWTHQTPNNGSTTGEQYVNSDYASYNLTGSIGTPALGSTIVPDQYIASGQGFMARTISSVNDTITFTDAMREKESNTQFFRQVNIKNASSLEKDRVWLNLESSEGGASSQILVGFFENATDGVDRLYDGIKISEGWINLYSKIDTLNYGIQGLGAFTMEKKVPLAFNSYIEDATITYRISIDRFEGVLRDNDIYLVDNELNITHDLKQGAYAFSIPSWGSYKERFTLQFTKGTLGIDASKLDQDFVVINKENTLQIKSNSSIDQVKIYDVTGRLLLHKKPKKNAFDIETHNIRNGTVLIVNATFENGTGVVKKAIKY